MRRHGTCTAHEPSPAAVARATVTHAPLLPRFCSATGTPAAAPPPGRITRPANAAGLPYGTAAAWTASVTWPCGAATGPAKRGRARPQLGQLGVEGVAGARGRVAVAMAADALERHRRARPGSG